MAVDTSALMAIVLGEKSGRACIGAFDAEDEYLISAVTLAETLIVAQTRGVKDAMTRLIEELGFEVVPVTADSARRAAEAHARWGKGRHKLNVGDCFAYEVAKRHACPLLYVGSDFAGTDVAAAL